MQINVKKVNLYAKLPVRAHATDAGLDIFACEQMVIKRGCTAIINTGITLSYSADYLAKIEDRSGMAAKGLRTGAGVVDAGYTGEIKVVMHNISATNNSYDDAYCIFPGDKIAQIVFYKIERPEVVEVNAIEDSERGSNGFNSTGI